MTRIAVLVSGSGSNLQALIDARDAGRLLGELALVVSNRAAVRALERAQVAGIEAVVLEHRGFATREAFDGTLSSLLESRGIGLVVLAGFMRLLGPAFVVRWSGRLVNVHPSLLPEFPGAHALQDALAARARRTGVTVHFVDAGTDTGPIIVQEPVEVRSDDDLSSLAERVHAVEHRLYPQVVNALAAGDVKLVDGAALWRSR